MMLSHAIDSFAEAAAIGLLGAARRPHGRDIMDKHTHLCDAPTLTERRFPAGETLAWALTRHFSSKIQAARLPLSKAVFALPGVEALYIMDDFVSVIADEKADWDEIERAVRIELERLEPAGASNHTPPHPPSLTRRRVMAALRLAALPGSRLRPMASAILRRRGHSSPEGDYEFRGFRVSWLT
jgi:hypothetical protein